MRLKLTLDRGNTCIKAALWSDDGQLVARELGDESQSAGELVERLAAKHLAEGELFDAIAWCTVVESEHADDEASLAGKAGRVIELTAATPMHLHIAYQTPATLGSDRIAAALGAIAVAGTQRPILVSDIGTAVTYDYVAVGSHYLGGNIAPGIGLRLRALAAFTDALPAVDVAGGEIPVWGRTTAEAMRSGAVRGLAAELEYYHRAAGNDAIAVITGGSAEFLVKANLLTFDYIYDPCLVHKGLFSIIKDEN